MAELIERGKLLKALATSREYHAASCRERNLLIRAEIIVREQPTTTEAEIRAIAQREIVEWCFDNKVDFAILERYADKERVVDCVLKHFVADQLKEESNVYKSTVM